MAGDTITEPFPISKVAENYLLFDVDVISHVRRNHNICGILIGTLPQVPQQNVFLGLPVQLMPEEARLLVEEGHAYIVDDGKAHAAAFLNGGLSMEERAAFSKAIEAQGAEAALAVLRQADERKQKALRNVSGKQREKRQQSEETTTSTTTTSTEATDETLFSTSEGTDETASTLSAASRDSHVVPFAITPTTSCPPLKPSEGQFVGAPPPAPSSYALFAHLHRLGYFMMPGLRFGCQYNVYPGDPLRFHSHFLAVGKTWNEGFRMMEIVGGGRLGTGVKKGFMLGGQPTDTEGKAEGDVRAFCIEWAGM